MAKINVSVLRKQLAAGLETPAVKREATNLAIEVLSDRKKDFLKDFDDHVVTQEISEGPGADNKSGTLTRGNLYSFIGFRENPIPELREYLSDSIELDRSPDIVVGPIRFLYKFKIQIPKLSEIWKETPMPWVGGDISWVRGIENYISGLGYYFHKIGIGRSGGGIQKKKIREGSGRFKKTDYMTKLLSDFRAKFR